MLFSGFARWKIAFNENVSFIDHTSEIRLPDFGLAMNMNKDNDV